MALEKEIALRQERERISADLHDEIGSTLSSINIYAGLAEKKGEKNFYLDSIKQNVGEAVSKLDDLVWSIKPGNETMNDLAERLISYAMPAATAKGIIFKIDLHDDLKEMKLPVEMRHHIYMITKEVINNAIKHAGCKSIVIVMRRENNLLTINIADDGLGFDASQAGRERNGLKNISRRVKELKGELEISSAPGKGTKVIIEVPLVL